MQALNINTNHNSTVARNALRINEGELTTVMQRLSTGKRINGAADDAAGLMISSRIQQQVTGLHQAIENAQNAVQMLQTAEGAYANLQEMVHRMTELALQATSGTYSQEDRVTINAEMLELLDEAWRVQETTEWNGLSLLNGQAVDGSGNIKFHIGSNVGQTISVDLNRFLDNMGADAFPDVATFIAVRKANPMDYTVTSGPPAGGSEWGIQAGGLITGLLNDVRGYLGSTINRLQYAIDSLSNTALNSTKSLSRIADADYSKETANLARNQIIQHAGTAVLAQANASKATVLALLQ